MSVTLIRRVCCFMRVRWSNTRAGGSAHPPPRIPARALGAAGHVPRFPVAREAGWRPARACRAPAEYGAAVLELVARPTCPRCERPVRVCWCAHVPKLEASTRLLIVQHPREEDVAIGTARMASLCVQGSTLVVGLEVENQAAVRAVLEDPTRPAILLWPSAGATDLETHPPEGPVSLVVIDGTWSLAKKLLRLNPRLAALPRYALGVGKPSEYRIRKEPRDGCLSTIEAIARTLGVLEGDGEKFAPMLAPFRAMVDTQIDFEAQPGGGRVRRLGPRPRKPRPVPAPLRDPSRVVVVAGEANAWPYGPGPRPADEIVHWVAARLDGTGQFEAFAAPRGPLSPTTAHHARLEADRIAGAPDAETLLASWRAFLREGDVVCAWGPYALDVLVAAGGELPPSRVDLRAATSAFLGTRAGSMASCCEKLGLTPRAMGEGRGGERLGTMVALARHLASRAAAPAAPQGAIAEAMRLRRP